MKKHLLFQLVVFLFVLFLSFADFTAAQSLPDGGDSPTINSGKHFIHIATAGNSTSNWTTIDNANTNGNPNAKLFITHNWNGSGSGTYNNHVSGLWYNSGASKWTIFNEDPGVIPIVDNSTYDVLVADETNSTVFQHTARPSNIISNWTILSHPELDGKPNARILVSQILIDTAGYVYNNREIGVWYNGSKWAIFNQNVDAMPNGASFNILVLNNDNSTLHTAVPVNISAAATKIDLPELNNNPNAIVYATQNWNGGGTGGVFNTSNVGVYYSSSAKAWFVFNEDLASMVVNSKYNIYTGAPEFVHKSESGNITSSITKFDSPLINRDIDAKVFALHNWNPFGVGTTTHDKTLGVYHTGSVWSVFNEDASAMPENLYFNVAIAPNTDSAFLHSTTASNIASNYTTIDNPLLNGNPNAIILVQPRYISSYHNVNVGLWYNGGTSKWTIFNQDVSTMAAGKDFNVWLLDDNKSFIHNVDSASVSYQSSYSILDNPLTNNNPDANILVTPTLNSGGYFNHVLGVWYYDGIGKWLIYTEDGTPFTLGLKYNVYIANSLGLPTAVEEENEPSIVNNFNLQQNFPNPFNPTTQIRFALAEQSLVILKVYNILGKEIATLVNEVKGTGVHEVSFDGSGLSSGVYFYTLQAGKFKETRKMILMK